MKLAGVAALAAGMVTLTGCEGPPVQALLPLRFEWVGGDSLEMLVSMTTGKLPR